MNTSRILRRFWFRLRNRKLYPVLAFLEQVLGARP